MKKYNFIFLPGKELPNTPNTEKFDRDYSWRLAANWLSTSMLEIKATVYSQEPYCWKNILTILMVLRGLRDTQGTMKYQIMHLISCTFTPQSTILKHIFIHYFCEGKHTQQYLGVIHGSGSGISPFGLVETIWDAVNKNQEWLHTRHVSQLPAVLLFLPHQYSF